MYVIGPFYIENLSHFNIKIYLYGRIIKMMTTESVNNYSWKWEQNKRHNTSAQLLLLMLLMLSLSLK